MTRHRCLHPPSVHGHTISSSSQGGASAPPAGRRRPVQIPAPNSLTVAAGSDNPAPFESQPVLSGRWASGRWCQGGDRSRMRCCREGTEGDAPGGGEWPTRCQIVSGLTDAPQLSDSAGKTIAPYGVGSPTGARPASANTSGTRTSPATVSLRPGWSTWTPPASNWSTIDGDVAPGWLAALTGAHVPRW